jgi:hypothetical protein
MSEEPRYSKARERQLRRKQLGHTTPEAGTDARRNRRRIERQAKPADTEAFDWTKLPYLKPIAIGLGALVFMGAIILGLGLMKNDPVIPSPNAIWLGTDWTYNAHADEDINGLIRRLDNNQIGTVYARVSELNYDGTWTGNPNGGNRFSEVQDMVTAFVQQFRRLAPNKQIYGTIYFRVDIGQEDNYRLDNPTIQEVVGDFAEQVVNVMGFDGVMLVVEPVWNHNSNDFLDLLRLVRQRIGNNKRLAVAVPPDWTPLDTDVPQTALIASGTFWEDTFKQRVALVGTDEIIVQMYNSYLNQPQDYIEWAAYQVEQYAGAIGELGVSVRVLIGLPAYSSLLPAHDDRIENIPNALAGLRLGLEQAGSYANAVYGVAIFTEADMDEMEWQQFRSGWLNN